MWFPFLHNFLLCFFFLFSFFGFFFTAIHSILVRHRQMLVWLSFGIMCGRRRCRWGTHRRRTPYWNAHVNRKVGKADRATTMICMAHSSWWMKFLWCKFVATAIAVPNVLSANTIFPIQNLFRMKYPFVQRGGVWERERGELQKPIEMYMNTALVLFFFAALFNAVAMPCSNCSFAAPRERPAAAVPFAYSFEWPNREECMHKLNTMNSTLNHFRRVMISNKSNTAPNWI